MSENCYATTEEMASQDQLETPVGVGTHEVGVSRGELLILPREAADTAKERRQQFKTLVMDASAHPRTNDIPARQEGLRAFFEKVCEAFQLERVRVYVEVIDDGLVVPRSFEQRRRTEVGDFLNKYVWLDPDEEATYAPREVVEDPTPDTTWQVSVRADEMDAFQAALYAKYLYHLMDAVWPLGHDEVDDVENTKQSCCDIWYSLAADLALGSK